MGEQQFIVIAMKQHRNHHDDKEDPMVRRRLHENDVDVLWDDKKMLFVYKIYFCRVNRETIEAPQ
jgi:hypothetical protein